MKVNSIHLSVYSSEQLTAFMPPAVSVRNWLRRDGHRSKLRNSCGFVTCKLSAFRKFWRTCKQVKQKKNEELITKLRLFLDKHGIIRANQRLTNAQIPYDQKYTVLIANPSKSHISYLIIENVHAKIGHQGVAHTLMSLRRQYWVSAGRRQVYSVITKCTVCRVSRARAYPQPTESDLPHFRLEIDKFPFTYTGIDTAGPIYLLKDKRWILIATCLTLSLIHISEPTRPY